LDFQEYDILCWLAELMKHRDADTGRRYKMLASRFIEKYQISTEGYDVIKGWRANASYFYHRLQSGLADNDFSVD